MGEDIQKEDTIDLDLNFSSINHHHNNDDSVSK